MEPKSRFVAALKVNGRAAHIYVSLADTVERGQVVARLDNDEYVQRVAQAEAELTVSRANLAEVESVLEIARGELERIKTLSGRGIASESQLDTARCAPWWNTAMPWPGCTLLREACRTEEGFNWDRGHDGRDHR